MRTVYNKFARGLWQIVEDGEDYYFYYHLQGEHPRLMLIVKGVDTVSSLAECMTAMYGILHPEIQWSDELIKTVTDKLNSS
jgi:hypothetical protein